MELKNFRIWKNGDKVHLVGKFICIDPCYVIPDDMWGDYCHKNTFPICDEYGWITAIVFDLNGKTAVQFSTAYGDGCYPVYDSPKGEIIGECGVDAGLLSFLPVDDEVLAAELVKRGDCGVFVELNSTFEYSGGDAKVGNILVTTGGGLTPNEEDFCPLCGDSNEYCNCDEDKIHSFFDKE